MSEYRMQGFQHDYDSGRNVTARKGKFNYFDWLLFTQIHEVYEKEPGSRERYDEEADIINSILNDMVDNGYDPVKVYTERFTEKQDQVRAIVTKYREKWKEIADEDEARRPEVKNGRA